VNVGGRNRLPMAELREAASELGFVRPQTLLQSGNLVFGAPGESDELARRLREAITARFGVDTPVILRTAQALAAAVAANPMPAAARDDPAHLLVAFLSAAPSAQAVASLADLARGGEAVEARGRDLYIHYRAGVAGSRLTQPVIDRRLEVTGTARNWNTVIGLDALAKGF
jgi:uncharacterized protein (DUF1697 family)